MREIKFRAWWRDAKLMSDVTALGNGWVKFDVAVISDIPGHTYEVQVLDEGEYDLMQFTGLLDRNGVEIYEGDIVSCFDTAGGKVYDHEVKIPQFFQEIWCETEWDERKKERTNRTKVEVIGNICENPDLLK